MITVDGILEMKPCYSAEKLTVLFAGRESVTWADVLSCEAVPTVDKIWLGIRLMDERKQRLFAVHCARSALALDPNPDPRSIAVCYVAERFADGKASKEELYAAESAAWSAARSAWSAARSAAESASRSAQLADITAFMGLL